MDDQLIRQAHDVRAPGAEAPLHAIVVGTGGFRDGDFAIADGDDILTAALGGYGKLLIITEVDRFHNFSAAGNPGKGRVLPGQQRPDSEQQTEKKYSAQQHDPRFGFHGTLPRLLTEFTGCFPDSIAKLWEKRKETAQILLDIFRAE